MNLKKKNWKKFGSSGLSKLSAYKLAYTYLKLDLQSQ